jgi:ankyrin repeat protein
MSVAAAVGDQERVEQLLKTNPELARRQDTARISPLSYAAREGHLHIVRLLLEHGADPKLPEDAAPAGRALYAACCGNHLEVAELLLKHGADPDAGVDSSECCLTIGTIIHGDRAKPLAELLRKHGALFPPYRMSVSQLKQAIRDNHPVVRHGDFFESVLGKGNPGLLDLYLGAKRKGAQRHVLEDAVPCAGPPSLIHRLLDGGVDPNRPDWLGRTSLHACAESGDRKSAALLLDAGADINAGEVEFRGTPLASAVRSWCDESDASQVPRRRQMVEFLLERGAATNLPEDERWATPLAWAIRRGQSEIVDLLKAHGAK